MRNEPQGTTQRGGRERKTKRARLEWTVGWTVRYYCFREDWWPVRRAPWKYYVSWRGTKKGEEGGRSLKEEIRAGEKNGGN